jgi:6-pyruvoyltetrahydropterin/6-carboxytetrahydropterin synthase
MRLMREVRCFPAGEPDGVTPINAWSGTPSSSGFEMYWVLRAVVEGEVDGQTGYLCNIKQIDGVLRATVIPVLRRYAEGAGTRAAASALRDAFPAAVGQCPAGVALRSLQLFVSPLVSYTVGHGDPGMVRVTHSFEFSASHRLFCPDFNDEENRRVFGKCSNLHGHGHNYLVDVTVSGTPDAASGIIVDAPNFQRTVKERIIDRFDHKHLNLDCDEFASLNPSVENIARVIWDHLNGAFAPARLVTIRVWETPKTYAEYDGSA